MQVWTLLTGKMKGKLLLPGWPQSSKRCHATPRRCQMSLNIFLFYTCLCPEVSPCHFRRLFRRALAVFDSIWSSPEYAALTSLPLTHDFHLKRSLRGGERAWGGLAILTSHFICLLFLVCSLARLTARRCVIGESNFACKEIAPIKKSCSLCNLFAKRSVGLSGKCP